MTAVHVLIAWFVGCFFLMVGWALLGDAVRWWGRRRRQARFDRARDTLGREGL